jgi:hypothetical protein
MGAVGRRSKKAKWWALMMLVVVFFFGMMLVVVDRGGLPYWSGSGLSTHTLEAQYDKPN